MVQHMVERGISLNSDVTVLARDPFEGPITVLLDNAQQIIGHHVATCILVEA
jgi:Fe2+ transport system protein FeoA